ncbi:MAG: aspartyl protease family protein [Verrucomicrobia bacterium]|nr:aspartyl protease family protein [Verrucomicrobiota bacterium]
MSGGTNDWESGGVGAKPSSPIPPYFHTPTLLFTAAAALALAGCAAFQDTRIERLPDAQVEQMSAARAPSETAGFTTLKMGDEVVSFLAKSWLDGDAVTTLRMINAFDRGDTHAIVEAVLAENVRVPMTVDTGAEADVLSPSLVDKLKLPLFDTGKQPLIVRGVAGEQQAFAGGLSSLRLGGAVIHNDVVQVLTEQHRQYTLGLFGGKAADSGILGLNTLQRFRWVTFDWRRRTVTFGRVGEHAPDPKKFVDAIPFRRAGGKLVATGAICRVKAVEPVDFLLDTGSDDAVMLAAPLAQKLGLLDPFAQKANRTWITGLGGTYRGVPFLTTYVQLGRVRFIKAGGHTIPSTLGALFGNKLMRSYKTTFDFANKKMVFENY